MAITVTHSKVNNEPAWTQAQLDAQIALGNFPPGTTLNDITLSTDWNAAHAITGAIAGSLAPTQIAFGSVASEITGSADMTYDGTALLLGPSQLFAGAYQNLAGSAFIAADGSAKFGSNFNINSTGTALLRTGAAAAGSEPLKFSSGPLLTVATAGTLEFLTDDFYATITSGAARKRFVLSDVALTLGRIPFATTNGRMIDSTALAFTLTGGAILSVGSTAAGLGTINILGNSSGVVSIKPQSAAGTYNFNLPTTAGSSGQPLLSAGGGASAMTFGTLGVGGGGTGQAAALNQSGVIYAASGSAMASTASGAQDTLLGGNGSAAPTYTTTTWPRTLTVAQVLHATATNALGGSANFTFGSGTLAVNSDVKLNTAGNGIYIKGGSNATAGVATMVAGTVTVNTTKVTANSIIHLTGQNTSGTLGNITVSARVAGTSFTITSAVTDTRIVGWTIIELT